MTKDFKYENQDYYFLREQGEASIFKTYHSDMMAMGGAAAGFHPENGSKIILVHSSISAILTEDEFNAVMLHEEGHLELGHSLAQTQEQIDINEVQADQYAIDNGADKKVLESAIRKLIIHSAAALGADINIYYELHRVRLNALRS